MYTSLTRSIVLRAALSFTAWLVAGTATVEAATTVNLTAQRATASLPDGTTVPMWQFCGGLDTTQTNTGTTAGGACPAAVPGAWSTGPTITVPVGDTLTINLTNTLKVPTSIVVLGQLGGGLGQVTRMPSPVHSGQANTTFPANGAASPVFVPPSQLDRVKSFATEVAAVSATGTDTKALTWTKLKPGTYIYETGTLPSLEAPMGLYGLLIVTQSPATSSFAPGDAYPPSASGAAARVPYDADTALLFSEIDPVQNAQVDKAAEAGTDITQNLRFNDPTCGANCFPAAVNYTPKYFLINGRAYDRTQPNLSAYAVGSSYGSGNILLRLANAGLRTHIPSVVGLPMSLMAEDGNLAPGNPKLQNEILLTAGKTYDALVKPASSSSTDPATSLTTTAYVPATFGFFDRQGSLTNANTPDGGMRGYLLVHGDPTATPGTPGSIPAAGIASAVNDVFAVRFNTAFTGSVTANDLSVTGVTVGISPSNGSLILKPDGSFTYTPVTGFTGSDTFSYSGNNGGVNATVTLTVGSAQSPTAANDSYTSNVASVYTLSGPGVLANDSDPASYQLTVDSGSVSNNDCGSVSVQTDGSFTVTKGTAASCSFAYVATNSQGVSSAAAMVNVTFQPGSGFTPQIVDADTGAAITDYRWTLQEDLTFKPDTSGTPSLTTRTLGTSFHRSHNPVVATGCVGPNSCGSGQQASGVSGSWPAKPESHVEDVALDPARHYFLSILPGDAGDPVVTGGDGHMMGGVAFGPAEMAAKMATIKLQKTPLVPAQLSIYIYEDNNPTNNQNDLNENGLGDFSIILVDAVGRSGDPAGQQTYDAFNMPLTNALLGSPGCPNIHNGSASAAAGNDLVGVIYTCPNAPSGYTGDPAIYALAGHALIKNITPARYDVIAHPGAAREGAGEVWWQVETLEGTPAQDAFTGINEPRYFQEFGPPGFHTTIGFVNPQHVKAYATANKLTGPYSITGSITNQHMSHPSNVTLWDAGSYDLLSSTVCRVALNSQGGTGPTIATEECKPDGSFSFTNVPAGTYEIAIFDEWLDQIIQTQAVTVGGSAASPKTVALGNIPVLSWFTQHDQNQLLDGDGSCDVSSPATIANCNLTGIPNVLMTVRYRNGSISNQTLTDVNGNGILVELFPLFNWYVSESDTTRYKQKAVQVTVDGGGPVDTAGAGAGLWNSIYKATPDHPTACNEGDPACTTARVEVPGAYSYGIQGFISQRNQIDWIKTPYVANENGGIQGTVVYASTRAFDDQRYNVQTIWEPLVPRVTMNLYAKTRNADGTESLTLVDTTQTTSFDDWVNTVLGADNNLYILGPDQKLRDPTTGVLASDSAYPPGRQVNLQCPGELPGTSGLAPWDTTQVDPFTNFTLQGDQFRCYDGFHDWNQAQAAPYDGKYQFPSPNYIAGHPLCSASITANCTAPAAGQTLVSLPPGDYVVEAVTPPGYEIVKEEDKNILIGDAFVAPAVQQFGALGSIFILPDQATLNNANPNNPGTGDPGFQSDPTSNLGVQASSIAFPECVGALHRVPDYLSLFPNAQQVAPFAGMDRPLCDRKLVHLSDQAQATATFFVYTGTPVAANATGIVLDDASSEFNAVSPDFGEKASVPFVPVSTKDFAGNEISRVYNDQWGTYNVMLPSSWLVNPPTPSGYGPNMLVNCINDPGPIKDPVTGKLVTDPAYNPAYSNFCYTNPFMPGQATYLDTPVLPIAAFAAGYNPADCAYTDATPAIRRVDSQDGFGPWVSAVGRTITIIALGDQQVQNPAYSGPFATSGPASQMTITRHYGFGNDPGKVTVNGVPLINVSWSDTTINGTLGAGTTTGELVVTAANGKSTTEAVTVTVGGAAPTRVQGANGQTIQAAIDAATPGDLIMVDAGTYNELVIMWKPVRLQGVGAADVIINAAKYPTSKLEAWRPRINQLFGIDDQGNQSLPAQVDPLPGQEITGGVVLLEPSVLGTEEGAGITVLAKNLPGNTPRNRNACASQSAAKPLGWDSNFACASSRIDGIGVTGGDAGGGIYVNGWAHNLEIANNRVYGNAGALHGGIRVGVPYLEITGYPGQTDSGGPPSRTGGVINGLGFDKNVKIHHNHIAKNGVVEGPAGQGGAGGGVSIMAGTDNYSVDHNWICGNYSQSDGGGIGHLGFSQGGSIAFNQILFNQSFQQTSTTHGGGIFVGGEPAAGAQALTLGSGNLSIDANVIRGNFAEAGHGGGIRLQQVNGADIQGFRNNKASWNVVTVTNNIIDNNVAGWSGGGLAMADTVVSLVDNNTIASNDSAGIAGPVLGGGTLPSTTTQAGTGIPSPAGISSEPHSAALKRVLPNGNVISAAQKAISSPALVNNIVWQNRSFYFQTVSGAATLCSSNTVADASGSSCNVLPEQTATGQCTGSPAYWDLGVLGDANAATPGLIPGVTLAASAVTQTQPGTPNTRRVNVTIPAASISVGAVVTIAGFSGTGSNFYNGNFAITAAAVSGSTMTISYRPANNGLDASGFAALDPTAVTVSTQTVQGPVLSPTYSVLTAGYTGGNNSNADPQLAAPYCNGSRITPEFAAVINPPSAKTLQVAATVDEGNNYVNLRFGPLTLTNPSTGAAVGDYHLAAGTTSANSSAVDQGTTGIVAHDVDNQFRPEGAGWDKGADELHVPAPIAAAAPTALSFGVQAVNVPSAPQTVVVSNLGDAPLTVSSVAIVNPLPLGSTAYSLINGCTAPVDVGGNCTISVVLTPPTTGPFGASLTITDNSNGVPGSVQVVSLTGSGANPTDSVSPTLLQFGTVKAGATSSAQTVTVKNTGLAPLTLGATAFSIAGTGTNGSEYIAAGGATGTPCSNGLVLAAGGTCTVDVKFSPSVANGTGSKPATLSVFSNASTKAVALRGTAN